MNLTPRARRFAACLETGTLSAGVGGIERKKIMTATGKKMRRDSGLTHAQLHRAHHSRKPAGKVFNVTKKQFYKGKEVSP